MLARQEQQFVRELETLATGLEEEAGTVRRFLARHYSSDWSGGAAEEYVSHPVNSLALVARLSHHLDRSSSSLPEMKRDPLDKTAVWLDPTQDNLFRQRDCCTSRSTFVCLLGCCRS